MPTLVMVRNEAQVYRDGIFDALARPKADGGGAPLPRSALGKAVIRPHLPGLEVVLKMDLIAAHGKGATEVSPPACCKPDESPIAGAVAERGVCKTDPVFVTKWVGNTGENYKTVRTAVWALRLRTAVWQESMCDPFHKRGVRTI